jgi:hypothetical protein
MEGREAENAMPHYHFDLVNTSTITDEGGADLPDDIGAMDSADEMARRILNDRPDLRNRHYTTLVTNEDGDEICRLPLDIIHQRMHGMKHSNHGIVKNEKSEEQPADKERARTAHHSNPDKSVSRESTRDPGQTHTRRIVRPDPHDGDDGAR